MLTERNQPGPPRRQSGPTAAVSPLGCSAVDIAGASWMVSSMSRRRTTQEATRRSAERNSNDRETDQHQWSPLQHHVALPSCGIVAEAVHGGRSLSAKPPRWLSLAMGAPASGGTAEPAPLPIRNVHSFVRLTPGVGRPSSRIPIAPVNHLINDREGAAPGTPPAGQTPPRQCSPMEPETPPRAFADPTSPGRPIWTAGARSSHAGRLDRD